MATSQKVDWLILGGNGQLGRSLQEVLREKNRNFWAPSRSELDITDFLSVDKKLKQLVPSYVVNAAAWTDVEAAEEHEAEATLVNALSAENLALVCTEIGATLIHISTDYVFSGQSQTAYSEGMDLSPISAYGRSKAKGEELIGALSELKLFNVRTAWLYSSFGRNFAKKILRRAIFTKEALNVVADQWGQPTSADDLAVRIFRMVDEQMPFGTYHGTNSGNASWFDFAAEILRLANIDVGRLVPVASESYPSRVQRPPFSVLGHTGWGSLGPMRDWRLALSDAMPELLRAVRVEE